MQDHDHSNEFLSRGKDFFRSMGSAAIEAGNKALDVWDKHIGTKPGEYIGRSVRIVRELGEDALGFASSKLPDPIEWTQNRQSQKEAKNAAKIEKENILEAVLIADYDMTAYRDDVAGDKKHKVTSVDEVFGTLTDGIKGYQRRHITKIEKKLDKAEAKKDNPGFREQYHDYRQQAIDQKVEKLTEKIADMPDGWRRRRLVNIMSEYNYKSSVHAYRAGNLKGSRLDKPELFEKKIDAATKKKVRKAYDELLRRTMDEAGIGRANLFERAKFVANLSKSEKRKIVQGAIRLARGQNIVSGRLPTEDIPDVDAAIIGATETRSLTENYKRTTR